MSSQAGREFTETGTRQLLKAWAGTASHHPRLYLEGVIERLRQAHLASHPGVGFRPPGSPQLPQLAKLLTSHGFLTPKGKQVWFPAQAQRLLEGQFDEYYVVAKKQKPSAAAGR